VSVFYRIGLLKQIYEKNICFHENEKKKSILLMSLLCKIMYQLSSIGIIVVMK